MADSYVFLGEERNFSYDKFVNAPDDCTPVYTWCWCIPLNYEDTDRDIAEFVRLGIRTVYILPEPDNFRPKRIPTTMSSEYMGTEYMEHYVYAVNKARENGINVWIYDEAGWPSGGAGGKVVKDHPEYARHKLAFEEKEYKAGETYKAKEGFTAFDEKENMLEDGHVFTVDTIVTEYYCLAEISNPEESSDFADISMPEAVDYFIEVTHEEYKKHLGDSFGKNIRAVFTDEPTLPTPTPFSESMQENFEKEYGFSIRPYLPILARKRLPLTEEEKIAVIKWYDYCSKVFCDSFMKRCKKWCNDNNLPFLGHVDMDHQPNTSILGGNYNIMRALREFDVPGIDVIWRHIFPMKKKEFYWWMIIAENRFFPRYASSAASQIGTSRAVTESFGVYGMGLTFDEMRYVLTFQAVRGINLFNFMLVPYGDPEGFQMTGELPAFKEKYACYSDLGVFNKYVERLSYMATVGKNRTDIALYLPIKDYYTLPLYNCSEADEFDRAGFGMEDRQIPFDIVDDDVFENADKSALENGEICMGDAVYTTVVITDCKYMSEKAQANLKEFILSGGRVITTREYVKDMFTGAVLCPDVWEMMKSPLEFVGDTKGIRLMHRVSDNSDMYFINNETFETKDIWVCVREGAYIVNLTDGTIVENKEKIVKLSLQSGEMVVIMFTDAQVETEEKTNGICKKIISDGYTIRKTKQFVIGENKSYSVDIEDDEKQAVLGNWKDYAGENFSGSCVYKTEFTVNEIPARLELDLGTVKYSCEVFVNGKSCGVKIMHPYRFDITSFANIGKNELEIRVSNTAANEFYYTKEFEKFEVWQLTPYHEVAQSFHIESLESGLYGPVKLIFQDVITGR